ncbi:uncharacterized protein LOC128945317 [Melozone crissalis]|uniref:uncharacterized protein LOC128945317 n=1 Tax=Melozone crissalis TaxID=40204 RepID=UPI0023DAF1F2|nr:uncharacterized protein LOC128945317 [Melozone crissalis]
MAELAGRGAGCARAGSPVPREEEPCSSSSSVCTEDLAASFWEAMVEPLLCQQEPAGGVPRAGAHPGQDEPLFPAGRSPDTAMEPSRAPRQDSSASRSSLESLGARISRLSLSQSHGGVSRPGPPAQAALAHGDGARGELLGTAGHPWIAAGMAAGRSRAGAGTGAPGSSAPRASRATARGHPALWGHGRNVTFSVAAVDREGAASSRSAGTFVGVPRPWRSPLSPGLRGDQKGELPCKQGRDPALSPPGLWGGPGQPRVTPLVLQRLRELERGSRHLLRQRLRVLHRLQGLLQRDRAQSLRLLREAMEQEPPGSSARWEHRPSRAGGSVALGNSPVALRNAPVAFRGHGPRPGTALAPGPSPAALSRALHVLRELRQQIQRRLGQWQGLEGALGVAGQRNEVI